MKNLKFRVWIPPHSSGIPMECYNSMDFSENHYSLEEFFALYDPIEFDIMQFVGTKDTKGQPIYDGDILVVGENLIGEVRYVKDHEEHNHEVYAGCFLFDTGSTAMPFDEYLLEHCEIIGNKYTYERDKKKRLGY